MSRWSIVLLVLLLAACSSPLRETAETEQPAAAEPAPSASPSPMTPAPEPSRAPEEQAVVPTPVVASPVPTPAPIPKPAPAAAAPDPVKLVLAEEAERVDREKLVLRLAAERDAAAAVLARRQKDLLAFKNPFLPRPQLSPEEAAKIQGMGGAARAQWAEARVAEAQAQLDAAQKSYEDAQATR